jgi:hypothetical protein
MSEINKLKKRIQEEVDDLLEIDEDSDLPIHERLTKQKKIRK